MPSLVQGAGRPRSRWVVRWSGSRPAGLAGLRPVHRVCVRGEGLDSAHSPRPRTGEAEQGGLRGGERGRDCRWRDRRRLAGCCRCTGGCRQGRWLASRQPGEAAGESASEQGKAGSQRRGLWVLQSFRQRGVCAVLVLFQRWHACRPAGGGVRLVRPAGVCRASPVHRTRFCIECRRFQ
jgi:hypothetical protein